MLNVVYLFTLLLFFRFFRRDHLLFISLVLSPIIRHLFSNLHILAIFITGLRGPHAFRPGSELARVWSTAVILNWISLYWLIWQFLTIKASKLINCIDLIHIILIFFIIEYRIVLVIQSFILQWNVYWNIWFIIFIQELCCFTNYFSILVLLLHLLTFETLVSTT